MRDGYSLADIAAATGNERNGNGMFGDNGAWFIILFLIFAVFGWGNGFGGFGGNRGNGSTGSGAYDNYVLASDFATIQRQLSDGFSDLTSQTRYIQNGLCDGFYAQAQLINGTNQNIANGVYTLNSAITNSGYDTRTAINGVSSQLANCCCDLREGIQGVNYNMATNTCSITNNATQNTRDIIDAINCSYNNLHNEIVANRMEDKNAQISAQQNEINALRLSASQGAQNSYLLSELKTCPIPAYVVPNPNCCYNYGVTQNGCGGCGSY